ncbi:MAG: acetyltransferase [Smithella sp.]|nr:acetyltransferase [Smithella sp.]
MSKHKKLVIVGTGETATIAYEYFTHDSQYEVVGFSVSEQYKKGDQYLDLPLVPFENIEAIYPPNKYEMHVSISYTNLNRDRAKMYYAAKEKGYRLANYISSRTFVWHNVEIGDNCFILENNVLQPFVKLHSNIILWSGNHIGHRTIIRNHCFVSSHVVISGYCDIGEYCFLGVNSAFADEIKVQSDCIIGSGAVVIKNTECGKVYVGNPAKPLIKSSYESFNVEKP